MHIRVLALLLGLMFVLVGCPTGDDDDSSSEAVDADGDGYDENEDCNDADASLNLDDADGDGYSTCDGDCDDADAAANLDDADADGFSTCDGDCDDNVAGTNPDAEEVTCDGADNDCDETTEDEPDDDGDGFTTCEGDCDDDDEDVNPAADEETCDGVDNDCDDTTEDAPDVDGDTYTLCDGDCDDDDAAVNPGATETTCDDIDNDCDPTTEDAPDADADGFTLCDDCNDNDAATNPDGTEIECDGIDNDCDPLTEDGPDLDGDGYAGCIECDDTDATLNLDDLDFDGFTTCDGDCDDNDITLNLLDQDGDGSDTCAGDCDDNDATVEALDVDADGVTTCDGDCDDNDPAQLPGADEYCNGEDDNCDGTVDEDAAIDAQMWYEDADADNFGNPAISQIACDEPPGFVGNDDDCDDADVDASPALSEWFDGKDNDCDGLYDDGVIPSNAIVITEVMINPGVVADSLGEWIELFNTTGTDINLIGAELYDLDSDSITLDTDVVVPAFGRAVIGNNDDIATNGGAPVDAAYAYFFLSNTGGDEIHLDHDGWPLDDVEYDGGVLWPSTASGASMQLAPGAASTVLNDDPDNWCEALVPYGDGDLGTPGDVNPPCCQDADGDGFGDEACGGADCDDSDPNINPGQAEICDGGIDNDCDPTTDESADADGDGYSWCQGDCDDSNPDANPMGVEVCDNADNDCNGLVDEGFDQDGDGYSECADDCDDSDAAVNPGATEVICDQIDNDCDPSTPDEADDDGDGVSLCAGDCDDTDADVFPGNAETHDAKDNDCNGLYDDEVLPANALIITEIMNNPTVINDEDGEWFEVLNNTALPINLIGAWIYDVDGDEFEVDVDLWIDPDTYAVLGAVDDPTINGGVTTAFSYDYNGDPFRLSNSGDEVVIDHGLSTLDEVMYDGGPVFPDPTGTSMNLDPDFLDTAANDDGANWCEATSVYDAVDGNMGTPGAANDECLVACVDNDGDGFEDAACGGMDCDDSDAAVNPNAPEATCDGVDNDCDVATEDDPDVDGDGFTSCVDDCDDADPAINPGAVEDCGNGVDDDCDQLVDGADDDCAPPVYLTDVQPTFTAACATCHDDTHPTGLDMRDGFTAASTVGILSVQANPMVRVLAGDMMNSYLWHKINGTQGSVGGAGQQMPIGGTLTANEIADIGAWIDDGAMP